MKGLRTPVVFVLLLVCSAAVTAGQTTLRPEQGLLDQYCITCHNDRLQISGLSLATLDLAHVEDHADVWEKVVSKLQAGMMPPAGRPRPSLDDYVRLTTYLEAELDRAAAENPDPGRSSTLRRLNATEYRNAIRDLLDLDIDVGDVLPSTEVRAYLENLLTR